jgi:ABC-2 type transport system ATP-binding protein
MKDAILDVKKLVKDYGSFRAVDGISFKIPKGKVIGLLGPNGAGKTTTIQILSGITSFTSGVITYFGKNFINNRQYCLSKINFTSSFNTLQNRITVWENLLVFSKLYAVTNPEKRIKEYLNYFEIEDLSKRTFIELSAGQRTRVNLIKALINDPELLLMDEPTASLDPDISDKMLSLLEEIIKKRKLSILYTSHDMNEVTRICDEVIFLDHGKIVVQDTPLNLTKMIPNAELKLIFEGEQKSIDRYLKEKKQEFSYLNKNTVLIGTEEKLIPKLIFGLGKEGIYITDIEVSKPTLEDVFLEIARRRKDA